jgi:hypothetical protein
MTNGKYETALMTFIPSNPQEWNPDHIELLTTAGTIDRLTDDIIRDSKYMAKKFTNFSEEMEVRGGGWSPMGGSTLRDLELNTAKLEVHKSYLATLLRMNFGPNGFKDFIKTLNA